jgi:hypothetical protein
VGRERRLCCACLTPFATFSHLDIRSHSEFNVDNDKRVLGGKRRERERDTKKGGVCGNSRKTTKLIPPIPSFSPQRSSTNVHFSLSLHYLILHPSHEKVNTVSE